MLSYIYIFLHLIACILSQQAEDVNILSGQPFHGIQNPGYPRKALQFFTTLQWNLMVESDANIKILCDDIRMGQSTPWTEQCEQVYISFDEGNGEQKVCGPNRGRYQYRSSGSKLTVKIVSQEGGGFIKCVAYNNKVSNPTSLYLRPDSSAAIIGSPEHSVPNFDQSWHLESPPGTKISLQCKTHLNYFEPCYKDVLTINNGHELREYCGSNKMDVITKENFAEVRLQLNDIGDLKAKCVVQAITGPNVNQYRNVKIKIEDSSEYGIMPGQKQTSCNCGWTNKNSARILFGSEAKENEYPWMVYLNVFYPYGSAQLMFSCGGSIISKRHVLTAAHCLIELGSKTVASPENVFVILAEHDTRKSSGKEIQLGSEKLFVHDRFPIDESHDIGLIYLQEDIAFSDIIGPICLSPNKLPVINTAIKIMGWGITERGHASDVLLKANAVVIDRTLCPHAEDFEICTHTNPSSTCSGDSGGPLVWLDNETNRYVQVSLVSRGHEDCQSLPTVSTQVASFYNWIQDRIRMTDPSAETCH